MRYAAAVFALTLCITAAAPARAEAPLTAVLSSTRGELQPGQQYTLTASIFATAPVSATADLVLPAGLIIRSYTVTSGGPAPDPGSIIGSADQAGRSNAVQATVLIGLDQDQPATIAYLVEVLTDAPRDQVGQATLSVADDAGHQVVDRIPLRVCCAAPPGHRIALPLVRR